MSKKMKIPSIFKSKEANKQPHWQWPLPSCKQPKTLSFRASDDVFKTVNSVFLDTSIDVLVTLETPESWFTNSSECASTFSADEHSDDNNNNDDSQSLEAIMQGVRSSERLFFEPGETSSILKEPEPEISGRAAVLPFKESVALALESDDPYLDFKKSMQEMVESHGLKEWDCLEELLGWYLRMNGKRNHGFIVGAFVDLLVGMANHHHHHRRSNDSSASSVAVCCSDTSTTSYSSAGSCFDSPRSPTGAGVMVGDGDQMGIDDVAVVVQP
ncbi:Transcription repressor OFP13 [Sesamum alatum]|uniref:Transcription repressor n=1 Tax=Sesamum alatum TaxID=300844 RepID=A0AAE2CQE5_9LAMI|nr:Transcription repressor OFP13 [Sesamum alatum]